MAFQTPIDLRNGVITNLHVVEEVVIDYARRVTRANMKSYVAKEFAEMVGEKSIHGASYEFAEIPPGNPLDFSYQQLKLRPEWENAPEVPEPVKPPSTPDVPAEPDVGVV